MRNARWRAGEKTIMTQAELLQHALHSSIRQSDMGSLDTRLDGTPSLRAMTMYHIMHEKVTISFVSFSS